MNKTWLIVLGVAIGIAVMLPWRLHRDGATPGLAPRESSLAERELNKIVPSVDIEGLPFDQAVAEIQKLTSAEINVDWKALRAASFAPDIPITYHGIDVPLWEVMDRFMAAASRGPAAEIGYRPDYGCIAIETVAQLESRLTSRVYNVRQLAFDLPPNDPAPVSLFTNSATMNPAAQQPAITDPLVRAVFETVAPDSWRDPSNLGKAGSILHVGDYLYIVADWRTHRKIQCLLRDLRALQAAPTIFAVAGASEDWALPRVSEAFQAALRRPIHQIDLNNVEFGKALDALRQESGVAIRVDWAVLNAVGVTKTSRVSSRTGDAPLLSALRGLCGNLPGGPLGVTVRGEAVEISTREVADKVVVTRVYDLRDFFAHPTPWQTALERVEELAKLIQDNVAPESWRDAGGVAGTINTFNGLLIVTQTWPNQDDIAAFLDGLRTSRRQLLPTTGPASEDNLPDRYVDGPRTAFEDIWVFGGFSPEAETAMHRPIDQIDIDQAPLEQAIETLHTLSGLPIRANWQALAEIEVTPRSLVSLKARGISLSLALRSLSSPGGASLAVTPADGILEISTHAVVDKKPLTRIYSLRDLVRHVRPQERQEIVEELQKLITNHVAPDTWKDAGGVVGSISVFIDQLVITQTWSSHEDIAAMLDGLRKADRSAPRQFNPVPREYEK